jgi:hypothetical protein
MKRYSHFARGGLFNAKQNFFKRREFDISVITFFKALSKQKLPILQSITQENTNGMKKGKMSLTLGYLVLESCPDVD